MFVHHHASWNASCWCWWWWFDPASTQHDEERSDRQLRFTRTYLTYKTPSLHSPKGVINSCRVQGWVGGRVYHEFGGRVCTVFLYVNANASASRNSLPQATDRHVGRHFAAPAVTYMWLCRYPEKATRIRKGVAGPRDGPVLASTTQRSRILFAIRSFVPKVGLLIPRGGC